MIDYAVTFSILRKEEDYDVISTSPFVAFKRNPPWEFLEREQMGQDRQRYLIYDGDCGFCEACLKLAAAYDRRKLFILCPYQSLPQRLSPSALQSLGLTRNACAKALQVITARGEVRSGAGAINYFLWQRWPGKILVGLLVAIPLLLLLEVALYRLIARYRHRLSGWLGLSVCALAPAVSRMPANPETLQPSIDDQEMPVAYRDR
ncbi:MAG: thiol-disulfide oxidoreductase DCC family protein [Acidobacteriota bacterium]|jgi:predicted DCC family thiol-disulfide oxidoreductase YuxK